MGAIASRAADRSAQGLSPEISRVNGGGQPRGGLMAELWGWWSQAGSNRRPLACHASALPAELWPHVRSRSPRGRGNERPAKVRKPRRAVKKKRVSGPHLADPAAVSDPPARRSRRSMRIAVRHDQRIPPLGPAATPDSIPGHPGPGATRPRYPASSTQGSGHSRPRPPQAPIALRPGLLGLRPSRAPATQASSHSWPTPRSPRAAHRRAQSRRRRQNHTLSPTAHVCLSRQLREPHITH